MAGRLGRSAYFPSALLSSIVLVGRNGDTLRICYDLSGKSRPAEFKTEKGTQLFLVTYKREKR